jgi:hypothetical protein
MQGRMKVTLPPMARPGASWSTWRTTRRTTTVRALPGRLSVLSAFRSKTILQGAFAWASRALSSIKRRFSAWAVHIQYNVEVEKIHREGSGEYTLTVGHTNR